MQTYSWNDIIQFSHTNHLPPENSIAPDKHLLPITYYPLPKSAVTIGGFDGMHLGHAALFDAVFEYKKAHPQTKTGVITFSRSPAVLKNLMLGKAENCYAGDISTERLKLEFFEKKGFDFCIMIDFSLDFSKIKGIDFLNAVRKFCSMQFLAAGSDFRCGHNSDTGVAELSDWAFRCGLELKVLSDVMLNGKRVSSSLVREAVQNGDFGFAKVLLGRPYCIDGLLFDFHMEKNSSDAVLSIVADRKTTQVLPVCGSYPVNVVFADNDGAQQNVCASLYVESDVRQDRTVLRLEFPLEQKIHSAIKEIEFI